MQRVLILMAALVFSISAVSPARADDADLRKEIAELREEMRAMKAEIDQLRQAQTQTQQAATAASSPTAVSSAAVPPPPPAKVAAAPTHAAEVTAGASTETTTLWGYGELNYNRPTKDSSAAQADVRRAVLGFGHAFSDKTRVLGELEWEHAVVSQDDQGESEVEQLYIEHQLKPQFGLRAGLILIPIGLLNEHHEPSNYYGVERNFVETAIIPSTWREGGVSAYGNTDSGLNWSAGIATGFDLGKWDATSDEGRESPLGSIHQEMQLARAHDPSVFLSANWQGIPGFTIGGAGFTGKIGQGEKDFVAEDARLTIGEGHARWQSGRFDLSGLYARGAISNTEALNLTFIGNPTPVPKSFWGAYAQGAWHAWQFGDSSVTPFLRYEEYNTASAYEPVPLGLGVEPAKTEHVFTTGVNYWLTPNVVIKGDYQHFKVDPTRSRVDFGVGYQF